MDTGTGLSFCPELFSPKPGTAGKRFVSGELIGYYAGEKGNQDFEGVLVVSALRDDQVRVHLGGLDEFEVTRPDPVQILGDYGIQRPAQKKCFRISRTRKIENPRPDRFRPRSGIPLRYRRGNAHRE